MYLLTSDPVLINENMNKNIHKGRKFKLNQEIKENKNLPVVNKIKISFLSSHDHDDNDVNTLMI